MVSVNIWTYMFEPPGPPFSLPDGPSLGSPGYTTKYDWPEMSGIPDLANYPLNHEVCGAIIYITGPFTNTNYLPVSFEAWNDNTNELLFKGTVWIPPPPPPDEWWDWHKIKFWIGHCSWEIKGPMRIRMRIDVYSPLPETHKILYLNVIDTSVPPTYTIKETINWQAIAPSPHPFHLFSLYGKDIDGTPKGFLLDGSGGGIIVTTSSTTRNDSITSSNITNFDCLTLIYDGVTTTYDWKINRNVI